MKIDRLYKNFEVLGDWQQRYGYIIELGSKLPKLDDSYKTEENRVHGCMSTVFMTVELSDEEPSRVKFRAESDTSIVNGLIAVLGMIYDGITLQELSEVNVKDIFAKLGLDSHLSPNRRNGFFAMVERIQELKA
ncbi:MAG: SufE family protein [Lentisphaerales bacterium]|nr:SufE family protein [Lentisphaerales bacterium]